MLPLLLLLLPRPALPAPPLSRLLGARVRVAACRARCSAPPDPACWADCSRSGAWRAGPDLVRGPSPVHLTLDCSGWLEWEAGGGAGAVFLVAGRGRGRHTWYELTQTAHTRARLWTGLAEAAVLQVDAAGEVGAARLVPTSTACSPVNHTWHLQLESMDTDGSIYQVMLVWAGLGTDTEYAVRWRAGAVQGALVTNQTRAGIPAPPATSVTITVARLGTTHRSPALALTTPPLPARTMSRYLFFL